MYQEHRYRRDDIDVYLCVVLPELYVPDFKFANPWAEPTALMQRFG